MPIHKPNELGSVGRVTVCRFPRKKQEKVDARYFIELFVRR